MTKGDKKRPTTSSKAQNAASNLLKGEKVSFGEDAAKPKATDEELNSRYAKGDIRIVTGHDLRAKGVLGLGGSVTPFVILVAGLGVNAAFPRTALAARVAAANRPIRD